MSVRRAACAVAVALMMLGTSGVEPTLAEHGAPLQLTRIGDLGSEPARTWGLTFFDRGGDGWADLLLGRHVDPPAPLDNHAGDLEAVSEPDLETIPPGQHLYDRHSCAWGEANGDGRPDLYCVSGAQKGVGTGPNQLLIATDEGLNAVEGANGADDPEGRGRSTNWIDFDMDGDLDLFVGNTFRKRHPNVMFENTGNGFQPASVGIEHQVFTHGSTWSDWDHNGFPDLLLTTVNDPTIITFRNIGGAFEEARVGLGGIPATAAAWGEVNGDGWTDLAVVTRSGVSVFSNDQGFFTRTTSLPMSRARAALWADLDNDGYQDLFVARGARQGFPDKGDRVYLNHGGSFDAESWTELPPSSGSGETVAAADFDRNGLLDLVVTNGRAQTYGVPDLLHNETAGGNWVVIDLSGSPWNPDGFGVAYEVSTGDLRYQGATNDGVSFRAQSDAGSLHFGIGANDQAEIAIRWPNGVTDCVSAAAGSHVSLEIGSSPCDDPSPPSRP